MGGAWERQIRTVRNVLASLLSHDGTQLDGETLRTFMVEAEAIVNCRPLTADTINSPVASASHAKPPAYDEVKGHHAPTWKLPTRRPVFEKAMAKGAIPSE